MVHVKTTSTSQLLHEQVYDAAQLSSSTNGFRRVSPAAARLLRLIITCIYVSVTSNHGGAPRKSNQRWYLVVNDDAGDRVTNVSYTFCFFNNLRLGPSLCNPELDSCTSERKKQRRMHTRCHVFPFQPIETCQPSRVLPRPRPLRASRPAHHRHLPCPAARALA